MYASGKAERVQLALRQREQDVAVEDVADRLLDRREFGAVQRSRGGHGGGVTGKVGVGVRKADISARMPENRNPATGSRAVESCTFIL